MMSPPIYPEVQDKASLSLLFREFLQKFNELIRTQTQLVWSETQAKTERWAATFIFAGIAIFFVVLVTIFMGVSLIFLLMKPLGLAGAAFATTGLYLVLAGIAGLLAKQEFDKSREPLSSIQ